MEWNIYKEWLDINLYRQMVSMIYQSSSREDKMNFVRFLMEKDKEKKALQVACTVFVDTRKRK